MSCWDSGSDCWSSCIGGDPWLGNDTYTVSEPCGDLGVALNRVTAVGSPAGYPFVFQLSEGYIALFYGLFGLQVQTHSIAPAGAISSSPIDTGIVTNAGTSAFRPNGLHVAGTIYVIAYQISNVAYVSTVDISDTGTINNSNIATHTGTWGGHTTSTQYLAHVSGNIYAFSYMEITHGYGVIELLHISSDGTSITKIDEWYSRDAPWPAGDGELEEPYYRIGITATDNSGMMLCSYYLADGDGWMFSFKIDGGSIYKTDLDLVFIGASYYEGWFLKISNGVVIYVMKRPASPCCATYEVDPSTGTITSIETSAIDTSPIHGPQVISLGSVCYALIYAYSGAWRVRSFRVTDAGDIFPGYLDHYEYSETITTCLRACRGNGDVHVVATGVGGIILTTLGMQIGSIEEKTPWEPGACEFPVCEYSNLCS